MKDFFEPFQLNIPAGKSQVISGFNSFITILECSEANGVLVGLGNVARGRLFKGLSVELPKGESFEFLTFYNDTASTITGLVILSSGVVYDNRLVLTGNDPLSVIQGELQGDLTPENWGNEKDVGVAAAVAIAANTNRKAFSLQAKESNAGIIYVGFDNTVSSTKWVWQLQAGMAIDRDDYRGDLYAIASVASQKLGWGEW